MARSVNGETGTIMPKSGCKGAHLQDVQQRLQAALLLELHVNLRVRGQLRKAESNFTLLPRPPDAPPARNQRFKDF